MKRRLESNEDAYNLARELAQAARSIGENTAAEDLERVFAVGTTATEQFGELALALSRLRTKIDSRWPPDSLSNVDEAIQIIRRAILRANRGG